MHQQKFRMLFPNSDVIVLSLPTPMDENNVPDYSALCLLENN